MDILVIDDEEPIRKLLTKVLQARGHRVLALSSAEEAIGHYSQLFYPLIIVDLGLEGMTGIDFCHWVRKQPDGHRQFLLVATGKTGPEVSKEILAAGADDLMAKPFTPDMLNLRLTVAEQRLKLLAERKKLESELKQEKDFISTVLETAPVLIVVMDDSGHILQFNRACREMTGLALPDTKGKTFMDIFLTPLEREKFQLDHEYLNRVTQQRLLDTVWVRPDLGERSISWSFTHTLREEGCATCIIGAGTDVTERRVAESRLAFLAERDPLTKCLNRSQLKNVLQKAAEKASSSHGTVLLYIDIDNFKGINDTLGHSNGDRVLISLVLILQRVIPLHDDIVRFGGDEFLIVLHRISMAEAQALAEKIRSHINDYVFNDDGKVFNISASIGLFSVMENMNEEEVLAMVEAACYAAKARGRNRVELYTPDNLAISRLIADSGWWTRIKEAMRHKRLELWFQPVVNVVSGEISFYESLIRYRDEEGRIIFPQQFLPSVERFGGIAMLDRYVIELAVDCLLKHPEVTLSVNVSERSLTDMGFAKSIVETFRHNKIPPERIIFEIPENVVVNLQQGWQLLDFLKKEGFRFALDDFGAGYCSISYLKHLPVEILKIDGSYIKQLAQQTMNQALVRSINEVAHILKLTTVAEHLEDQETLELVRNLGIDHGQGYLFGEPEPFIASVKEVSRPVG